MHIQLDQRRITNATEAMDFPGFYDQDVTRAGLELLAINRPKTTTFGDELDFIVRMSVRPGPTPGLAVEEEH